MLPWLMWFWGWAQLEAVLYWMVLNFKNAHAVLWGGRTIGVGVSLASRCRRGVIEVAILDSSVSAERWPCRRRYPAWKTSVPVPPAGVLPYFPVEANSEKRLMFMYIHEFLKSLYISILPNYLISVIPDCTIWPLIEYRLLCISLTFSRIFPMDNSMWMKFISSICALYYKAKISITICQSNKFQFVSFSFLSCLLVIYQW